MGFSRRNAAVSKRVAKKRQASESPDATFLIPFATVQCMSRALERRKTGKRRGSQRDVDDTDYQLIVT